MATMRLDTELVMTRTAGILACNSCVFVSDLTGQSNVTANEVARLHLKTIHKATSCQVDSGTTTTITAIRVD